MANSYYSVYEHWLNEKGIAHGKFQWQDGYGAFSISYWDLEKIKTYIMNQAKHHQRMNVVPTTD
jgi:hypothetical protein